MKDNKERMSFTSGAIREPHQGKGAYYLIPRCAIDRIAKWYEQGASKYAPRNWEKGIPTSNCLDSMLRHAFKVSDGWDDEDHLAAVCWNAMSIMFMEAFRPDMCDIPKRDIITDNISYELDDECDNTNSYIEIRQVENDE